MSDLRLSPKYKAFLKCQAPVEFLEGTTYAGKTTVGAFKFILKCFASPKKLHIIAAKDTGTAEKNIINKDLGILDNFSKELVEYNGNGTSTEKIPHLLLHAKSGDKVVYILGYSSRDKWEKALGGQYGCLYIDEINTADMDFVQEATMRCDYLMATLNPDDPALPVYEQYVNSSRPLSEWAETTPQEILRALSAEQKPGWTHWFFSFDDNLGLTPEKLEQVMMSVPKGTKRYKNKILGLRGKSTGLVFSNFDRSKHVISKEAAKKMKPGEPDADDEEFFIDFSTGCDTAYSSQSPDTIAMSFWGLTNFGRIIKLDERVYNNRDLDTPLAPSDTVENLVEFAERNRREWGFGRAIFIDSADQATLTEAYKYKTRYGCIYDFVPAYKKTPIIDRIYLQLGWMASDNGPPKWQVCEHCRNTIYEMEVYSWREDKDNTPEDGHDHCINSDQYAWLPWKQRIGVKI